MNIPELHASSLKYSEDDFLGSSAVEGAFLAVLMPVFNEIQSIDSILSLILSQPSVREVIAVDDGSTDGSGASLEECARKDRRLRHLSHPKNRGKGAAIRTALAHVTAPVVLIQDADLEYDPFDYEKMLDLFRREKADAVYGSRFYLNMPPNGLIWHTFSNRMLTAFFNVITGLRLTDEATCYKMFSRRVLEQITLEEDGFGFCPEVSIKVAKLGVKIHEVPIRYKGRTRAEGKKLRWRDGLDAVRCILKYQFFSKGPAMRKSVGLPR